MDQIYEKLYRSGCMEKEDYLRVKDSLAGIKETRSHFLKELEEKNRHRKTFLRELHEQEVQLIAKIKQLIQTEEFKRAYRTRSNQEQTRHYMDRLENHRIECTKGLAELKEIKSYFQSLIVKQKQKDQKHITQIKKQVGKKIWNDLHHHFQSQSFLALFEQR